MRPVVPADAWWACPVEDTARRLDTGLAGLTSAETARRLAEHGLNALRAQRPPTLLALVAQRRSPVALPRRDQ
jgi:hypothetical protein